MKKTFEIYWDDHLGSQFVSELRLQHILDNCLKNAHIKVLLHRKRDKLDRTIKI